MQETLLKNNHLMMNTQVETFIIEETEPLIYDNVQLEKWHGLVEKLDLKGQKKVAKQNASPIPFLYMNQQMILVCRTLCPSHVAIENYDLTPIPLPVLDLVALSKKENYFQEVEIWYDEQSPDPFCVGIAGQWVGGNAEPWMYDDDEEVPNEKRYRFDTEAAIVAHQQAIGKTGEWYHFQAERHYLIAKWGDVKQSFEELTARAKARHKESMIERINKSIANYQMQLANVDVDCDAYFNRPADDGLPF
jgi:hypothetical protein